MSDCTEPHHFQTEYHGEASFYPVGSDTVPVVGGFKLSIGSQSYLLTRQNVRDMADAAHRALGDPVGELQESGDVMSDEAYRDECAKRAMEIFAPLWMKAAAADGMLAVAVSAFALADTMVAERRRRNG